MSDLKKWTVRFLICLLMNLSHIPIAKAQNVSKHPDGLLLSEEYFRDLKTKEMQLEVLNKDYVELDLECRIKNKNCGFDLNPRSFTYILLSGVVIGYLIAK